MVHFRLTSGPALLRFTYGSLRPTSVPSPVVLTHLSTSQRYQELNTLDTFVTTYKARASRPNRIALTTFSFDRHHLLFENARTRHETIAHAQKWAPSRRLLDQHKSRGERRLWGKSFLSRLTTIHFGIGSEIQRGEMNFRRGAQKPRAGKREYKTQPYSCNTHTGRAGGESEGALLFTPYKCNSSNSEKGYRGPVSCDFVFHDLGPVIT